MGVLFELLAQILMALVAAAFAQMADLGSTMLQEQPSVQRTVVQSAPRASANPVSHPACPEQARLQAA